MRQFGLIGYPLSHSFSKKYFTQKFEKEQLKNCRYDNFSIPSIDQLTGILTENPLLEGFNITIPYKEQVIPFLSKSSEVVTQIKACNCIRIENGGLTGHNTDVTGFKISLKEKLAAHHKNALILGTGGAAKAVEYVLQKIGIHYRYVSRTPSAHDLSYAGITPDLMKKYTLIINTTPLGMFPNIESLPPLPYGEMGSSHYLFDLVYNPEETLFLQKGKEQGAVVKNGQDMLIIQAEESWKIWNGIID